jgi:hypothetical protein
MAISQTELRLPLLHFFYVAPVVGSSLAYFGTVGFVPAALVIIFWAVVFYCPPRPRTFGYAVVTLVGLWAMATFMLLVVQSHPPEPNYVQCVNNLKQITLALHSYHDLYGTFPPAYVADDNGKPMHSWRVLILPFVEQDALYKKYRFDEPWDGPNNRLLFKEKPRLFGCPLEDRDRGGPSMTTSYLAVVGSHAAWRGSEGVTLGDLVDPLSTVVLVTECAPDEVIWTEPRDLEFEEAVKLAELDSRYASVHGGWNVGFADASVRRFQDGTDVVNWREVLTMDDGRGAHDGHKGHSIPRQPKRILKFPFRERIRLLCLGVTIIFPLPWVWLNPKGALRSTTTQP